MVDPKDLDALLAEMAEDEAPLDPAFRSTLLADATRVTAAPPRARWWQRIDLWGGAVGVPLAAACGLWLGLSQPALVLGVVPGAEALGVAADLDDATLLDDIYGSTWEDWL